MQIIRSYVNDDSQLKDESIFNCSSGFLGVRGCFEEGTKDNIISIRGTYINGFCESEPISYNEKLFGFTDSKQTIVNLPDAQSIEFYYQDKKICCWDNNVIDYSYCLDMKKGIVSREFVYETNIGKIKFVFERLSSFIKHGIFAIRVSIESLGFVGNIKVKSYLNPNVKNFTNATDPRVASGDGLMLNIISSDMIVERNKTYQETICETINSKRKVKVDVLNILENYEFNYSNIDNLLIAETDIDLNKKSKYSFEKYCYYREDINDNNNLIFETFSDGFEKLKFEQESYMNDFWDDSRVIIKSDFINQEKIDFCLYEMLCATGKDGLRSVGAKGLSGEGYEGHYFWDCETYIFPFFSITNFNIAKSLLEYRYSKLEEAKKHARNLGHTKGALYPWRTITGSECSSYFPSGSAQYHINGDIARAFIQYWNISQDYSFLEKTCEVLLETARLWIDTGHFTKEGFKIDCVTGPDEYTCLVNNNYYTNAAAANNLKGACDLIQVLKSKDEFKTFVEKTGFEEKELGEFEKAYLNMYYPYDRNLGIIAQDDSFLKKKRIDLNTIPKDNFPMLLNYHPLFLYRYQVCKQADAVLAEHLFSRLNSLDSKKTFDYYEEITTHDSSLSKCIFAIEACKHGDLEKAKEYFIETMSIDLDDHNGNTRDGLHLANMGGVYRVLVCGFGGLRLNSNGLSLFPMLPNGIEKVSFNIKYLNCQLNIEMLNGCTYLKLKKGASLKVNIYGKDVEVTDERILCLRKPVAYIFDLDGVITDTAIYHYQAWKKIAEELEIEFNEEINESFKGVSRNKCLELLLSMTNKEVDDNRFNELLEKKNEYYKELLANLTPESILPGIKETIDILRNNGNKIALFSVSKNTPFIIERLGIENYFDTIISGFDVDNSKPHYEGYLKAASNLHTDPKLCVMIEDSAAGIIGAKKLSMKTIAIMKENVADADICINSTNELKDAIEKI